MARNHDLEGNVSLANYIVSHPDDGETAVAEVVLDAIPASEGLPDSYRIVQPLRIAFLILCDFSELVLNVPISVVAEIRCDCRLRKI